MYAIRHLNRADIDRAFPLVRLVYPDIDLEGWRGSAKGLFEPGQGIAGLVGVETSLGHMAGLFRYRVNVGATGNRTLVCDYIVAPQFLNFSVLVTEMAGAAAQIGRRHKCDCIVFPDSAKFGTCGFPINEIPPISAFANQDHLRWRKTMTIKHVLVHIDESRHVNSRLDVAIALARRHDAHLSGIYVMAPPYIPTYMAGHLGAAFYENHEKIAEESAARAGEGFEKKASAAGLSREWMSAKGLPADVLSVIGRYADLIVIGQPDPDEFSAADPAREVPGDLILEAGRPIMVVPYAGKFKDVGRNVLVMWNASREATRAINDGMPILKAADRVVVTSANAGRGNLHLGDLPGADISHQLARHGVPVESAPTFADDIDIGDLILSRAADVSADLLVMGGYGRSRFREMVLGGATRHVLNHMTVPVLFSH